MNVVRRADSHPTLPGKTQSWRQVLKTSLPEEMFSQLKEVSLTPSTRTLHGPGSHTLAVRGKFTASLQYKNRKAEEEIYVIPGSRNALLGLPAIQKLELLSRVDNVKCMVGVLVIGFNVCNTSSPHSSSSKLVNLELIWLNFTLTTTKAYGLLVHCCAAQC